MCEEFQTEAVIVNKSEVSDYEDELTQEDVLEIITVFSERPCQGQENVTQSILVDAEHSGRTIRF